MKNKTEISKFLSYVLRHNPADIGIVLDKEGWVEIDTLIAACNDRQDLGLTQIILNEVVQEDSKQRYRISGTKIRASQGHTVQVELGYLEKAPPDILYHGTYSKVIDSIHQNGINQQKRQHVHLSSDIATARNVGARRGKPVILSINSKQMYLDGLKFYLSDNNVWLTEFVDRKYIIGFIL